MKHSNRYARQVGVYLFSGTLFNRDRVAIRLQLPHRAMSSSTAVRHTITFSNKGSYSAKSCTQYTANRVVDRYGLEVEIALRRRAQ